MTGTTQVTGRSTRLRGLLAGQAGLARALWWTLRRRTDVGGEHDVPLPTGGIDRALLWTITGVGVIEIVVVHVLVSWPVLRWPLFAVGVYGLLGFLAFAYTLRQHPHLLRPEELVLRFGHFRSVRVPLEHLASVRKAVRNDHKKNLELDDDVLALSFMGQTNVELRLSAAAEIRVDGRLHPASRVACYVDDPRAVVAMLRARADTADR